MYLVFSGVEDVTTDCKTHKVIVKGEKADPLKVRDRVQRKSHNREVELLSPIPKPPSEEEKKQEEKEKPKPEEKKEEVSTLSIHFHNNFRSFFVNGIFFWVFYLDYSFSWLISVVL